MFASRSVKAFIKRLVLSGGVFVVVSVFDNSYTILVWHIYVAQLEGNLKRCVNKYLDSVLLWDGAQSGITV